MSQDSQDRSGEIVGNYRLFEVLGRGGMGVVYRAEHVYIGKIAAIKVLHRQYAGEDDAVRRFLREAWAASAINHSNIVNVLDFGETPTGGVFLVMEFSPGRPLDAVIAQDKRLSLLRAISIMNQVTSALAAAHGMGILHRDLKPENILVDRRKGRRELIHRSRLPSGGNIEKEDTFDHIKVLDFGVAKIIASREQADDTDPNHRRQKVPGFAANSASDEEDIFGTPEYMAPEAASGGAVDARTDVYAAGVMFYEMLTGCVPIQGATPMATLVKQISEPVVSPRRRAPDVEITDAAERVIMRALEKDPNLRHPSMEAFYDELQECYGQTCYKRNTRKRSVIPGGPAASQLSAALEELEAQPVLLLRPKNNAPQGLHLAQPIPLTKVKSASPAPDNTGVGVSASSAGVDKNDEGAQAQGSSPGASGELPAHRPRKRITLPLGAKSPD